MSENENKPTEQQSIILASKKASILEDINKYTELYEILKARLEAELLKARDKAHEKSDL